MRTTGWKVLAAAIAMLLFSGVPNLGATTSHADTGCCGQGAAGHHVGGCRCGPDCGCAEGAGGCGCACCNPKGAGRTATGPCSPMHDNTMAGHHGHDHKMMHGGMCEPKMMTGMAKHLEEMKGVVKKLREIEARMAGQIRDGEAFRASSLEHARLLTDLQDSHLKHMEKMLGGGK